jgi:uncharacterized protein YdaU (DUF1376 family)
MGLPYMPLYVSDYLSATSHLSAMESGAYLHLLMHYWQKGSLPSEDRFLARIARMTDRQWIASRTTIQAFFVDGWRHERVDLELGKAGDKSKRREESGTFAAKARWGEKQSRPRYARILDARTKGTHTDQEWAVMESVFGGCVKCGVRNNDVIGGHCNKDHVISLRDGGSDAIENLQPLCKQCNSSKGASNIDYRELSHPGWKNLYANRMQNASKNTCDSNAVCMPSSSRLDKNRHSDECLVNGGAAAPIEPKEAGELKLEMPRVDQYKKREALSTIGKWWNCLAVDMGLRGIDAIKSGSTREKHAWARCLEIIDDHGDLPSGLKIIDIKIRGSPFLSGRKNGFAATFDWIVTAANYQKIVEGNYDEIQQVRR